MARNFLFTPKAVVLLDVSLMVSACGQAGTETASPAPATNEAPSQTRAYSAWDAGVILFREGLEAILVIAALLTFLKRSGNADKRKWIWSGAGAGVLLSGVLAVILTVFLSQLATGSSREFMEGIPV